MHKAKYVFPPGLQFGDLSVIEDRLDGWAICRCVCGNTRTFRKPFLLRGQIKSCGCNRGHPTHGMEGTPTYNVWAAMLYRCRTPTAKWYSRYGGRGIKVCERWYDFQNFFIDMGEKPPGLSIDRIDNDGDYEPGNCRWASRTEQIRNRGNTLMVEYEGRMISVAELSQRYGLSHKKVVARLKRGLSIEEALATTNYSRWK